MPQFILDATTYSRLMDALLAASADAYISQDADPFKIALGEIAGIWPESVLAGHDESVSDSKQIRHLSPSCFPTNYVNIAKSQTSRDLPPRQMLRIAR